MRNVPWVAMIGLLRKKGHGVEGRRTLSIILAGSARGRAIKILPNFPDSPAGPALDGGAGAFQQSLQKQRAAARVLARPRRPGRAAWRPRPPLRPPCSVSRRA